MASPVRNNHNHFDDPRSPASSSRPYSTTRNYPETTTTQDDLVSTKTFNDGSPQKHDTRRDSEVIAAREPIELSEPCVPEIYDPAYYKQRPKPDDDDNDDDKPRRQAAEEWEFLEPFRAVSGGRPRSDVSSTGAVANNVIAPRFSISERKRQLALGSLRARPDEEEAIAEEDEEGEGGMEKVAENLVKANLNRSLNELLTKTKIAGED